MANHFPSSHIRGNTIKPFFTPPKNANTSRSIDLMSAKSEKITTNILHINSRMRRTLCPVY